MISPATFKVIVLSALLCLQFGFTAHSLAATFNDAANGNWNSGATWGNPGNDVVGSGVPGASDDVVIDSHTVSISADAATRNITIAGGTLNGGSSVLSVTSASGLPSLWEITSGTFNAQTGTVNFVGIGGVTTTASTTFYNLGFNPGNDGNSVPKYIIPSGVVLTINNTLTIDNSSTGQMSIVGTGAIDAKGDVTIDSLDMGGGSGTDFLLNIVGTGNQTMMSLNATIATGGFFPNVVINKLGTLTLVGTFQTSNDWTYVAGTIDATTNNSIIDFRGNWGAQSIDFTPGSATWNTVRVHGNGWPTNLQSDLILAGDWWNTSGFNSNTYGITFVGTGTSTVTTGGVSSWDDIQNLTISKTGNVTVQLQNYGLDVDGTLAITSGTFDLNGQNISTVTTCTNSGTLKLRGDETVSCTPTHNSGSVVEYTATSSNTSN